MGSCSNDLKTILDAQVLFNGKKVTAVAEDGMTELVQSIIFNREEVDQDEPFYILDLGVVMSLYKKWNSHLPMIQPHYAVKCNPDPSLLEALAALGSNFDCASPAEIESVLALGVSPDRIIYAHPCKAASYIKYAASVGVNLTTFDSIQELDKIRKWHPKCALLIRIVPPVDSGAKYPLDSKFGARPEEVRPLLEAAQALELAVTGVSFHIGSEATNFVAFRGAIAAAKTVFETAAGLGMTKMNVLDIGGGFNADNSQFHEAASIIKDALQSNFPNEPGLTVISEPGRFFAERPFMAAAKIIGKRVRGELREYWINDGKFGTFAWITSDQVIAQCTPLHCNSNNNYIRTSKGIKNYNSTVFGPTCDAFDKVSTGHRLPELEIDDWLLFTDMGAYTAISLGTSFNGFNTAAIQTYPVLSNLS